PLWLLIVEDSEDDALLLTIRLREAGYEPSYKRVETPEDLRAALAQRDWDMVLSDHDMPRFNAQQALKIVRESGIDVPFIIISGKIDEPMAANAMRGGAQDYLLKDNLTRLIPVIERELAEAAARRQTHAALREREALLRLVVDSAGDAIIVIDEQGSIELFNPAAEALFGYTLAEAIGQSVLMLAPDAKRAEYEQRLRSYVAVAADSFIGTATELTGRHKDGSTVPIDVTISETWVGHRRVFTFIVRDIRERKRADAEKLSNELARVELDKERQMIELKERFISMITHEFRTPLSVIFSSCEILTRYFSRLPLEKQLERIRHIQDMTQYMVNLLNDVMLVSKGQSGKLPFNPHPLDVEPLCMDILEHAQLSDSLYHRFAIEASGDLRLPAADEKLLHSAVTNLVSNAMKYTPAGGSITVRLIGQDDAVLIEVSDDGMGIPAEDHDHIFEAFHRAANVQSIDGTGLGLGIVKNAIDAHGGTVTFCSVVNLGTTFTIHLPRH
ncbi:MAG: PAS domain S-box protein, partial [Anaerolineae bacterium]|nr:PAS domain S-box protein [Anaerolineae bacterium]